MKHTVRSFSVGLLTSAVILLVVFLFMEDSAQTAEDMDAEEMIPYIEEQGFTVLTTEEYVKFSVNKEEKTAANTEKEEAKEDTETAKAESTSANQEEENNSSDAEAENTSSEEENQDTDTSTEEDEAETEDETPTTFTLTIESGMPSSNIGTILAEQNIIENAGDFTEYLDEHDYSLKVRAGTFEVSAGMSFYEIAEIITN